MQSGMVLIGKICTQCLMNAQQLDKQARWTQALTPYQAEQIVTYGFSAPRGEHKAIEYHTSQLKKSDKMHTKTSDIDSNSVWYTKYGYIFFQSRLISVLVIIQ